MIFRIQRVISHPDKAVVLYEHCNIASCLDAIMEAEPMAIFKKQATGITLDGF